MALITNAGQRGQDNTTLQTEGTRDLSNGHVPVLTSNQIGEVVTTIPTIGFNVESVTYKNLNFNVWVRLRHIYPSFTTPN
jgi:hypothetical protein